MDMKKKLRKSFTFALALIMMAASVFTGIGTAGLTEVQAAEEPAGRGTDWDILYSEIRANGSGKAYQVGTRIYMDIPATMGGRDSYSFYVDTLETAISLDYIQSTETIDRDYTMCYMTQSYEKYDIVTLQDTYINGDKTIKSGGYWIFNLDNGNGDEFYGVAASSENEQYKDVKIPTEDLDIVQPGSSTGGSSTPGQKITELEVNIDWSKVPGLTVGASAFPDVPESACQTTSTLVKSNGYGWAVKATEDHVTKGYLRKDVYDEYAIYDHWIPVYMFDPSYVISADDVYYCYSSFVVTDSEHKFADEDGVNVTSILRTNVSEKLALTDGGGKKLVVFLRLGTPAEILEKNGGQIGGTGGTEPSEPTTPKYELTSEQVTTTDEIEDAYVYEWNDLDVFDALMDAANDYLSKLEHSNDKGYLYVIPLNQYNGKKYMAWGFGSIKIDGQYVTLEKIGEYLENGTNVYILKPYEPGSNTPGGEEPKNNTITDLVISANTPVGSVSGLEKVFETIAAENNKGYTAADQAVVAAGGSAKIYLDAKLVTSETSGSKAATEELTKAGYQSAIALDLSVIKEIRTVAGVTTTTKLIELPGLISVIADIPEAYQGKSEYCIYRNHEGIVDILTTSPNADGEYIELSADGKQLILHIKKFSEYVLGYKESASSPTPSTPTDPMTPANSATLTNQATTSTTQATQTAATTATSPKTGEDTSLLVFMMIFAFAGLSVSVVYRKMKNA